MVTKNRKAKHHKNIHHKNKNKKKNILTAFFLIFFIAIIVFIFITINKSNEKRQIAALINGEKIYLDEVMDFYNKLPDTYKELIRPEQILDEVINERLLLQEVTKKGLSVLEEEIDVALNDMRDLNYDGFEDFESFIYSKGLTVDEIREFLRKQTLINKLLLDEAFIGIDLLDQESVFKVYNDYLSSLIQISNIQKFPEVFLIQELATKKSVDNFAECLTDRGVKFYGSNSCPYCDVQKELFGNSFDKINYVDCIEHFEICKEELIRVYPTWDFKGVKQEGVKTISELSTFSGCEL